MSSAIPCVKHSLGVGDTGLVRGTSMICIVGATSGRNEIVCSSAAPHDLLWRGLPEFAIESARWLHRITMSMISQGHYTQEECALLLQQIDPGIAILLLEAAQAELNRILRDRTAKLDLFGDEPPSPVPGGRPSVPILHAFDSMMRMLLCGESAVELIKLMLNGIGVAIIGVRSLALLKWDPSKCGPGDHDDGDQSDREFETASQKYKVKQHTSSIVDTASTALVSD